MSDIVPYTNRLLQNLVRKEVKDPRVNEVQSLRQESQLHREFLMLEEQNYKIKQDLNRCQQEVQASKEEREYFQQLITSKSNDIRQLLKEEESLLKDLELMQDELIHLQEQEKKTTQQVDQMKLKYLVIQDPLDLVQEEDEVLGKRFKFYPSLKDSSQLRFFFQEDGKGFLIGKISAELGFTICTHRIAFPSKGIYHMFFQARFIQANDFLIGITTENPLQNETKPSSVYFNFANKAVEHNGKVVSEFQCELACDSTIVFVMDMNQKRMICCVDKQFQEIVSLHPFKMEHQSLLLFLGVSNNQTLIYFSNS